MKRQHRTALVLVAAALGVAAFLALPTRAAAISANVYVAAHLTGSGRSRTSRVPRSGSASGKRSSASALVIA